MSLTVAHDITQSSHSLILLVPLVPEGSLAIWYTIQAPKSGKVILTSPSGLFRRGRHQSLAKRTCNNSDRARRRRVEQGGHLWLLTSASESSSLRLSK
eukprot:scaffold22360_cov50-Cyclotella_meneghiniana.AAC.1